MFLARGFDAASMADIAKAAGVSKGTLYVYFKDKDELFTRDRARRMRAAGRRRVRFRSRRSRRRGGPVAPWQGFRAQHLHARPHVVAARTVIAVAERMPELGRRIYETGPAVGIARLAAYLRRRSMPACWSSTTARWPRRSSSRPATPPCSSRCCSISRRRRRPERIDHVVGMAVRVFMAAYRAR